MAHLITINHEVYIQSLGNSAIRFDGVGIQTKAKHAQVGEVACLSEWQKDPGKYGPHYAVAALTDQATGRSFWAGGSFVFIRAWASAHNHEVALVRIFDDRNVVRAIAEQAGGVAW